MSYIQLLDAVSWGGWYYKLLLYGHYLLLQYHEKKLKRGEQRRDILIDTPIDPY